MFRHLTPRACALILSLTALAGCGTKAPPAADPPAADKEHGHKPGLHGGTIVNIGNDRYHAEILFGKDGVVQVYTRDRDETEVKEVEARKTEAYARLHGGLESESML